MEGSLGWSGGTGWCAFSQPVGRWLICMEYLQLHLWNKCGKNEEKGWGTNREKKKGIWGFGLLDYKKNKEFSYHLFISFLEG